MIFRPLNIQDTNEIDFVMEIDYQIPSTFDAWHVVSDEHKQNRKIELSKLTEKDFFIVCELDEKLIGFHYLQITKWNSQIAMINTTWVSPLHRGKKIAIQMKKLAEEWAKSKGVERILTGVHIDNAPMNKINQESGFILRTNGYMKKI
jgi:RimJ/RimL family protein N-acetyltransferase